MRVQIYSDEGDAIESTGEPGELVCTAPFPSQPAYFWGDTSGQKYRSAYYEKFPGEDHHAWALGHHQTNISVGIWHQGDYIRLDPATQGVQFLGRSDGVLNPSGWFCFRL